MAIITMSRHSTRTGNLILINGDHPCNEPEEDRDLVPADRPTCPACTGAGRTACKTLLLRRVAAPLDLLVREVGGWGRIVAVNGWRPYAEQKEIWDKSLRDQGPEFTQSYVAKPGHSEHQTGLAIDLGYRESDDEELDFIRPAFPYDGVCREFRRRAAAHGFIERYRAGKEGITGVAHEPWHFRYIGRPHAAIVEAHGFALEEYMRFLEQFDAPGNAFAWREDDGRAYAIWRVEAHDGPLTDIEVGDGAPCAVSGDNRGGFIVTEQLAGAAR